MRKFPSISADSADPKASDRNFINPLGRTTISPFHQQLSSMPALSDEGPTSSSKTPCERVSEVTASPLPRDFNVTVPLFSPKELAARHSNLISLAALRYQIFCAESRWNSEGKAIGPNGLAPALIRKRRRVYIHEAKWLAWMLGYEIADMSFVEAERIAHSLRISN